MAVQFRNAVFAAADNTAIDMEISSDGGVVWFPFTATEDDTNALGQQLYADAFDSADPYVTPSLPTEVSVNPVLSPELFGAKGDGIENDAVALQNFCNYCRDVNEKGHARGSYFVGDATITQYTDIDWSGSELVTTLGGQTVPAWEVAPNAADVTIDDATANSVVQGLVDADRVKRGVRKFAELAAYKDYFVFVNTGVTSILRDGGGSYRYEWTMNPEREGYLSDALSFDVPDDVDVAVVNLERIREKMRVTAPTIRIKSGTTPRTVGLIEVSRSNTILDMGGFSNDTTTTNPIGIRVSAYGWVTIENFHGVDLGEDGTQYGINARGLGHRYVNVTIRGSRRGYDGNNAQHARFHGCRFIDGLGGHFGHDTKVFDCDIHADHPNASPLRTGGGSIEAYNCTLHAGTQKAIYTIRGDVGEAVGVAGLYNCHMGFRWDGGPRTIRIISSSPSSNRSGNTPLARDIRWPDAIKIEGGTVTVLGSGLNKRVFPLHIATSWTPTAFGVHVDTSVSWKNVSLNFENGDPKLRFFGTREDWWRGPGFTFDIDTMYDVSILWGSVEDSNTYPTEGRADWRIRTMGQLDAEIDFEAVHKFRAICDGYTLDSNNGSVSKVGDEEWWFQAGVGGAPEQRISIPNGTSYDVPAPGTFGRYVCI
jgi:hypothetical protein